ncbi:hypothetical protein [Metasolibacillus meyeri]|uniref:hypothetical protein n=1 Tax=Metasolibacillus meyeri TaxID=1071052 RepID=UPI000D2FC089|nr:hypothetical protein [Metasolibacillus meyeri]
MTNEKKVEMTQAQLEEMIAVGELAYHDGVEGAIAVTEYPKELVEVALKMYIDFKEIIEWRDCLKNLKGN